MQFNLKNWRKQYGNFDFWNRTDNKIATFEKILNKDRNKKKQGGINGNNNENDKRIAYYDICFNISVVYLQFSDKIQK